MYAESRHNRAKQAVIEGVLFGAGLMAGLAVLQALFMVVDIATK
jgi:hypothetical protein